jgi:GTP-dependent phosphoenolpyruvate carboxykinase
LKESVLFTDFAMKVVGEIWPKGKGENTVNGIVKGQEGQWLMSCNGHSFSRKETRFALIFVTTKYFRSNKPASASTSKVKISFLSPDFD